MKRTATALLAAALASPAFAAAPAPLLTYSGYLHDSAGAPVTGSTTLVFSFYTTAGGASALWQDTVTVLPSSDGYFSAVIGANSGNLLDPAQFTQALWMGIQVSTDAAEMSPRIELTSTPYALTADWAYLTSKPSAFPPTAHTHAGGDVTSAVAAANSAPWTGITGKPSTFPPSAHTHAGTDVTSAVASATDAANLGGHPASYFSAVGHTHPGTDITSTVASATNAASVPWSGITGMPAGFADGVDNVGMTAVTSTYPIVGDGSSGNPVRIATPGSCVSGYDLRFNGTNWDCYPPGIVVSPPLFGSGWSGGPVGLSYGPGLTMDSSNNLVPHFLPPAQETGTSDRVARGDHLHPMMHVFRPDDFVNDGGFVPYSVGANYLFYRPGFVAPARTGSWIGMGGSNNSGWGYTSLTMPGPEFLIGRITGACDGPPGSTADITLLVSNIPHWGCQMVMSTTFSCGPPNLVATNIAGVGILGPGSCPPPGPIDAWQTKLSVYSGSGAVNVHFVEAVMATYRPF